MWYDPKLLFSRLQFPNRNLKTKYIFVMKMQQAFRGRLYKLNQWACKLLTAAFTSCCHPWGVSFQTESLWDFHSWAEQRGAARCTELWTVQFVRSWLTDNKLYHQSKNLPSTHWSPLFAVFPLPQEQDVIECSHLNSITRHHGPSSKKECMSSDWDNEGSHSVHCALGMDVTFMQYTLSDVITEKR